MNNTEIPKGKYAWSVTVGTKGQIVIPKEARDLFGIRPGDSLLLLGDEEKGLAIPQKTLITSLFSHLFNSGSSNHGGRNEDEHS